MPDIQQLSYIPSNATARESNGLPYLPIILRYRGQSIVANGLLDTGATINVLPFSFGQQLGIVWNDQATISQLAGNLAASEARGVMLSAIVSSHDTVRLAFAWTDNDRVPLILGQVNFFQAFEVCFYGFSQTFAIQPRPQ